jgi:hypothetical protein
VRGDFRFQRRSRGVVRVTKYLPSDALGLIAVLHGE